MIKKHILIGFCDNMFTFYLNYLVCQEKHFLFTLFAVICSPPFFEISDNFVCLLWIIIHSTTLEVVHICGKNGVAVYFIIVLRHAYVNDVFANKTQWDEKFKIDYYLTHPRLCMITRTWTKTKEIDLILENIPKLKILIQFAYFLQTTIQHVFIKSSNRIRTTFLT